MSEDTPPPVCTGSGTCPPSLQGVVQASALDNMSQCGICLQVVRVAWSPLGPSLTVHPFRLVGNVFVINRLRQQLAKMESVLKSAEAALADIGDSEGPDRSGNYVTKQWCENRAREALPAVREALVMVATEK